MIGWMEGTLLEKQPPRLLINVHGIGYELEAPMSTFNTLAGVGDQVTVHIHQIVREDAHALYAFSSRGERDFFRMLLKVNGVGAKLGLTVLSGMEPRVLAQCIFEGDTASLSRLPGIGKKTAERLVVEMRDKLGNGQNPFAGSDRSSTGTQSMPSRPSDPVSEAVSALVALGLKPNEASRRVQAVECEDKQCEDIVRLALQSLAR